MSDEGDGFPLTRYDDNVHGLTAKVEGCGDAARGGYRHRAGAGARSNHRQEHRSIRRCRAVSARNPCSARQ